MTTTDATLELPVELGRILLVPQGAKGASAPAFVTAEGGTPAAATTAVVRWDEQALTVEFTCSDAQIVAQKREHDDPDLWKDDCVELYLDPGHSHDPYGPWIHIVLNAAGCVRDEEAGHPAYTAQGMETAATIITGGWEARIRIPWSAIGAVPQVGAVWGFNLNRTDYPAREFICFSPTHGAFANIHRWGHLVFADAAGSVPGTKALPGLAGIPALAAGFAATAAMAKVHAPLIAEATRAAAADVPLVVPASGRKSGSVFFGPATMAALQGNLRQFDWAQETAQSIIETAQPWKNLDDQALWDLMFDPGLLRSWNVFTDGWCPQCKAPVKLYSWTVDAWKYPWKMQCPACAALFPKNDAQAYYRSGLDAAGVFAAARADRRLLVNEEVNREDKGAAFGVDDGSGYFEGENRWLFTATYLVYGQWKQLILGGVTALASAYAVSGEAIYARKAAILLDRIADFYPGFDFMAQAIVHDRPRVGNGYVSIWHDACEETRALAQAYDCIFPAISRDPELVAFLARQAARTGGPNPKSTFAHVQRNIEERILIDALNNYPKIHSNYPRAAILQALLMIILGWPENEQQVLGFIDRMAQKTARVDGLTGEKGLGAYSAYVIQSLAGFLGACSRIAPGCLERIIERNPKLKETWRFHIDTRCLGQYYPQCGDDGWFTRRAERYAGVAFRKLGGGQGTGGRSDIFWPSAFTFFWELARITGDPAYLQLIYEGNDDSVANLPHDLFEADPARVQAGVQAAVAAYGPRPLPGCVNKEQWHLAILRSGEGDNARAAWLDYDTAGSHGHCDGLNLGLFAHGLDLMPDLGYPPVQYGGWSNPKIDWYMASAAHNTVVIDGAEQNGRRYAGGEIIGGKTTLWCTGRLLKALRVNAPRIVSDRQFERTVLLIDIAPEQCYLLDIFRVVGGKEHAKYFHSHFGTIATTGLNLGDGRPGIVGDAKGMMRNFRTDPAAAPGWRADWQIDDRNGFRTGGTASPNDVGLRYLDLTPGAEASTCEGWVSVGSYNSSEEAWIPRLLVRRSGDRYPLASTFVTVIEPFRAAAAVTTVRRLELTSADGKACSDADVAVEVQLPDGQRDIVIAVDVERAGEGPGASTNATPAPTLRRVQTTIGLLETDAQLAWLRVDAAGVVRQHALAQGRLLSLANSRIALPQPVPFVEG